MWDQLNAVCSKTDWRGTSPCDSGAAMKAFLDGIEACGLDHPVAWGFHRNIGCALQSSSDPRHLVYPPGMFSLLMQLRSRPSF